MLDGHLGQLVADRLELAERPPEGGRSLAYSTLRSIIRPIDPTAPSAITSRSHWKLAMIR